MISKQLHLPQKLNFFFFFLITGIDQFQPVCLPFTPFMTCFPLIGKMPFLPRGLLTEDQSELNCWLFLANTEKVKNVLDYGAKRKMLKNGVLF